MAFIEPCFGIGHNLSLICQMTSEDIKHQLIALNTVVGRVQSVHEHTRTAVIMERVEMTFCTCSQTYSAGPLNLIT